MNSAASDIAIALEAAVAADMSEQYRRELAQERGRTSLLLDVIHTLASNLDLDRLLQAVLASVRGVMACDEGIAALTQEEGNSEPGVYTFNFPQSGGLIPSKLVGRCGGPCAAAFERCEPVVVSGFDGAGLPPEIYRRLIAAGLKSICFIPLVSRGRALGLFVLGRRTQGDFTRRETDFLGRVGAQVAMAIENRLAHREIAELKDRLARETLCLEEEIRSEFDFDQIIGRSPALRHVLELVQTVAATNSTVLLRGETGTGKELIARAIRDHSRRKEGPFVKLNCAAIPTGLLESELFGHEKGAFTGAITQKIGRFELADEGTLFLDEIGDIPLEIQPKLLQALQEQQFDRLGGAQTRKVNVRLIAATNRHLEAMVAAREFRSDLFYRLNVFPIHIPPLRERSEDIPLLVRYFVQKFAKQMQKPIETIPAATLKGLVAWDWPGNIRELENFIERAVILTRGKSLDANLAEISVAARDSSFERSAPLERQEVVRIVKETLEELNREAPANRSTEYLEKQRQEIISVLRETKGRVGGARGAAARIGISRTTLLSRMQRLGISPKEYS